MGRLEDGVGGVDKLGSFGQIINPGAVVDLGRTVQADARDAEAGDPVCSACGQKAESVRVNGAVDVNSAPVVAKRKVIVLAEMTRVRAQGPSCLAVAIGVLSAPDISPGYTVVIAGEGVLAVKPFGIIDTGSRELPGKLHGVSDNIGKGFV
jgi:hypothetical protein